MNAFIFKSEVYRLLAEEGLTPDSALQRIRRERPGALKGITGKQLDDAANAIAAQVRSADSPLTKEFLALQMAETKLRGDIQEVLESMEPDDPRSARELAQLFARISQRESGGFALEAPQELADAAEMLGGEFPARLAELYPGPDTAQD